MTRKSDYEPAQLPKTVRALADRVGQLQSDIQALAQNADLESEINRKLGTLMIQINDRLTVIEATMNATVFKSLFAHTADIDQVLDDDDEISAAEAWKLARQPRQAVNPSEIQTMPRGDGSVVYRMTMPGKRYAKIVVNQFGELAGPGTVDEPDGSRSELSDDEIGDIFGSVIDMRRRAPTWSDRDENYDNRVLNPERE